MLEVLPLVALSWPMWGVVCRAGEHKTVKGWSGPTRFAGVGYSVKIARGVD